MSRPGHCLAALLAIAVLCAPASLRAAAALATASTDLQAGKADEATALLTEILRADPKNAEANNLLCRVEYTVGDLEHASAHCEKAVSLDGTSSRYHLWLGRMLGERAGRANFMSAFGLAKRTREEFETAVNLAPKDGEAMADLGEFYREAPGAVGGGMDKARTLAAKLEAVDPERGREFRGSLLDHEKDTAGAEREYRAAIQNNPHPAHAWIVLASFLRRHERWEEMEAAVESGYKAALGDRRSAVALYNGATLLEKTHRRTDLAVKMLAAYAASPDKTEEAPAFDALARLARLRHSLGDQAGAQKAQSEALALAHNYRPALEALK